MVSLSAASAACPRTSLLLGPGSTVLHCQRWQLLQCRPSRHRPSSSRALLLSGPCLGQDPSWRPLQRDLVLPRCRGLGAQLFAANEGSRHITTRHVAGPRVAWPRCLAAPVSSSYGM
ncbi:hypothetical protein NDU88_006885 [Pleurodeles waltl]|uniref:Uncharacterized protein n=1 Tax=Pleurodeles waltl TaxID=8319 RepID=A0AAV7NVC1_PLEWA|nr:hypothetical protein NDU88_006885 [Pleurodeles waltl]